MTGKTAARRPTWVSDELFPYESRFIEVDGNVVHYVDEGRGPTVLMYHGNPTWSFLYRGVIEGLRDSFRCVAFDYPGFGLSRPSSGYEFTVEEHARVSEGFIEALALDEIIAFVQDWGGPIGLGVAARDPDRYQALIVGNTFAWPAEKLSWKMMSAVLGGPLGRLAIDRWNFLAATVGRVHKRRHIPIEEAKHYSAPFPGHDERRRTRRFIAQIGGARPFLDRLSEDLPAISHLPSLLLWGPEDRFYKEEDLERFRSLFPNNTTHVLEGSGHFIQSEAPEEITQAIKDWFVVDLNEDQ